MPIAIGILICSEQIKQTSFDDTIFIGELSLDGTINRVNGILPICIEARKLRIKRVIVSIENTKEASIVSDIEIIGVKSLSEVVKYLNSEIDITPYKTDINKLFNNKSKTVFDFSEVKGQENIKI